MLTSLYVYTYEKRSLDRTRRRNKNLQVWNKLPPSSLPGKISNLSANSKLKFGGGQSPSLRMDAARKNMDSWVWDTSNYPFFSLEKDLKSGIGGSTIHSYY